MKSSTACAALSILSLPFLSVARPLDSDHLERRKPASYSVVAVGGASATDGSSPTQTVTDAVTETQTVMRTQVSTIVITAAEKPTTIVFTVTTPAPTTIINYAPASVTTQTVSITPAPSQQPPPEESSPPPVPVVESPATVTVTEPLPSTRPYDNGQWHTNYYYTVPTDSPSSTYTAESQSVSPTPTFDDGLWHGAAWTGV